MSFDVSASRTRSSKCTTGYIAEQFSKMLQRSWVLQERRIIFYAFWLLWCNELLYVHRGKVFDFSLFTTIYINTYTYPYIYLALYLYIYIYQYLVQIVCEYQPYRTAILPWNNPNILSISGFRWVPFKQLMWFVNQRSPYLSSMYTFIQNVTIKFQNSKDEF